MTQEELGKRGNALLAYMGGPGYLKDAHYKHLMDVEFQLIGLDDLEFHTSWDWIIPVWVKLRHELSPTMIIHAISCIDTGDIAELHMLLSNVAMNWCKNNKIEI